MHTYARNSVSFARSVPSTDGAGILHCRGQCSNFESRPYEKIQIFLFFAGCSFLSEISLVVQIMTPSVAHFGEQATPWNYDE